MLVISRRIGESFLIGDDIEATVLDITDTKVILGISAPKDVSIVRTDMREAGTKSGINRRSYGSQYKENRDKTE